MKKFYSMLALCAGMMAANAAETNPVNLSPEVAKPYMIQHRSGNYMTVDGTTMKIMAENPDALQVFYFANPVEGDNTIYTIKSQDGKFVCSDPEYKVVFNEEAADAYAQYNFEAGHENGYLKIHNLGINKYLGTDKNDANSEVYTNKGGNDGKEIWRFIKIDMTEVLQNAENFIAQVDNEASYRYMPKSAVDALKAAKEAAAAALGTDNEGQSSIDLRNILSGVNSLYDAIKKSSDMIGFVPVDNVMGGCTEEAHATFEAAINAAKAAWDTFTAANLTHAASTLNAAYTTFKLGLLFVPGDAYYIIHNLGTKDLNLTANEEAAGTQLQLNKAEESNELNAQNFKFVPVPEKENTYYLMTYNGKYMTTGDKLGGDKWNAKLIDDEGTAAEVTLRALNVDTSSTYVINTPAGIFGVDNTSAGSGVYTDKATWDDWKSGCRWQIYAKEAVNSSVEAIEAVGTQVMVMLADGMVQVAGNAADTAVNVYSLDGRKVATAMGECAIELERGFYVVAAGSVSKKVFVK